MTINKFSGSNPPPSTTQMISLLHWSITPHCGFYTVFKSCWNMTLLQVSVTKRQLIHQYIPNTKQEAQGPYLTKHVVLCQVPIGCLSFICTPLKTLACSVIMHYRFGKNYTQIFRTLCMNMWMCNYCLSTLCFVKIGYWMYCGF